MRPGNTWLEKLAYSNVWLALTASGFAIATLFVAGARDITRVHLVAVLLPALSMYVVYTFDKVVKADPVADAQNDPERSAFVEKYKPLLLALAGVALLVGSGLATVSPGGVRALALFGVPFPIAYAYGTNVLPPGFRYRRLKDVTGGKSLTVAATWAVVGVTLPLVRRLFTDFSSRGCSLGSSSTRSSSISATSKAISQRARERYRSYWGRRVRTLCSRSRSSRP